MSTNHVHTRSFKSGEEAAVISEKTISVDAESKIQNATISAGATDHFENFQVDVSRLQDLYMHSTEDVTVATNAPAAPSGAPDQEISLPADKPIDWMTGDLASCPVTSDVSSGVYISNAGSDDAVVNFYAGHN